MPPVPPMPSMPSMPSMPFAAFTAAPAPSTPWGQFADSAVAWTTWITLMAFVGLLALALAAAGPAAQRVGPEPVVRVTLRLVRVAAPLGVLAVPAVLTDLAREASESDGYKYAAAWGELFGGGAAGVVSAAGLGGSAVGVALVTPLTVRSVAAGRARTWLLRAGLGAGVVALGTSKLPTEVPEDWAAAGFQTLTWMLHLLGGAVWVGGLAGLLLLCLPGVVARSDRGAFWSVAIRRFSVMAMSCVAAIVLSGSVLYWEHVDGPSQLLTTMYGRVLGVKILIFGTLLLLGIGNQFWLHPRIEALRAAGDRRPLRTILARRFPALVAAELLLGMTVLFVAPFLHGSARNEAFQAAAARAAASAGAPLPEAPDKHASASTWVWGTTETLAVVVVMVAGYRVSGRLARAGSAVTRQPAAGR